jgi:asparagine synthetase B (glutamine-hydrolysing)
MCLIPRCEELKAKLFQTHRSGCFQSILLSGGLDSSILASLLKPPYAVTIGFGKAEDFTFADIIANEFCKIHIKVLLDHETLLSIISKLIGLMKIRSKSGIQVFYMQASKNQSEEVIIVS